MKEDINELRKFGNDYEEIAIIETFIEQDSNLLKEYEDALNKAIEATDLHTLQSFYQKRIQSVLERIRENEQKLFLMREALKQKIEYERKYNQ
jgi:hypothetical protein